MLTTQPTRTPGAIYHAVAGNSAEELTFPTSTKATADATFTSEINLDEETVDYQTTR